MKREYINDIYNNPQKYCDAEFTVAGWLRNIRNSKSFGFIDLNDGSCFEDVQIVFEQERLENFDKIIKLNIGSAIVVRGIVVLTPQAKQPFEIQASTITVEGSSTPDYPLQNKRHSVEFLRENAYLRARTRLFSAAFRVRSETAFAIHNFFNSRNFVYVHTPLITCSDCEGAGEMFKVTTLDLTSIPINDDGNVDFSKDFFSKSANLTVSGQLEGETFAMAFGKIYTFGPTFRAENSNTSRHAAEFWMIEPEIAFADIDDIIELAWDMIKHIVDHILRKCSSEIEFFDKFIDNQLSKRLHTLLESAYAKVTYTQAIELLKKSGKKFNYPVEWGSDLQTEHERFLTEEIFKKPIFVVDYPKEIKSFYMRLNPDNKTVAAMDLLVPGVGEIIGGSQREERYDYLLKRMNECGLKQDDYWWYLNLRKYGSTKHAGFGLGFERILMYLTGIQNIRDVIPYPRTVNNAEF
ncbi:MAG: asparagine--tRNA ligase [bacterium]|nr:asparagine--tRNA ligase [bacterium]